MDSHVKIVGIVNIVFGVLGLIAAAIVLVAVAGGGLISGDETTIAVTSIVAVSVSSVIAVFSIPQIIAGIGLLKLKNWGRILGMIVAVLDLLNIPFGTAFGIYALWVLLNAETEKMFRGVEGEVIVEDER